MISLFETLDLRDADAVMRVLREGARANREARCRHGSIDVVERDDPCRALIATGDLHDNPLHLARVLAAAGMDGPVEDAAPRHLTLHELIHSDRLLNGMDFSFRVLARVAALKAAFPERVHVLLANHELAQVSGSGIVKDGVRVVDAFNDAVRYSFPDRSGAVNEAVVGFIRSMPLALRCRRSPGEGGAARGDVLCAHSLPAPEMMDRFDPGVLERELSADDYAPRRGSAHLMVWGRGQTPEQLGSLAARWGVELFLLGHEKAESGALALGPNAAVLNSDHPRGVYLPVDLDEAEPLDADTAVRRARPLSPGVPPD